MPSPTWSLSAGCDAQRAAFAVPKIAPAFAPSMRHCLAAHPARNASWQTAVTKTTNSSLLLWHNEWSSEWPQQPTGGS